MRTIDLGGNGAPQAVMIGETRHWDGNGVSPHQQALPPAQSPCLLNRAAPLPPSYAIDAVEHRHLRSVQSQSSVSANPLYAALRRRTPGKTWKKLAALATFLLDPVLLGHGPQAATFAVKGELIWTTQEERRHPDTLPVHPVILISPLSYQRPIQRVEIIPHLQPDDPLLQHLILVLQAEQAAESTAKRYYVEALTNALAVHFLKRYTIAKPSQGAVPYGLSPHQLRCATAYIEEHLEHELSLAKIAAVTHISIAHFARLFRQDTGMTPHQFVIHRRIERARQLLANTELSLSEIGNQVGFTDQSHFIAVFRKHVGVTPRLYRRQASGTREEE